MVLRDLTLRSASSFGNFPFPLILSLSFLALLRSCAFFLGSFHLVRLLFDEYILYYVERKLEEHRRAVGSIVSGNVMGTTAWSNPTDRGDGNHHHHHHQTTSSSNNGNGNCGINSNSNSNNNSMNINGNSPDNGNCINSSHQGNGIGPILMSDDPRYMLFTNNN